MTERDVHSKERQKYVTVGLALLATAFIGYTFLMVGWLDNSGMWNEATAIGFTAGFAAGIGGLAGSFALTEVFE